MRIEYRWAAGNAERLRRHRGGTWSRSRRMSSLASGTPAVAALQQAHRDRSRSCSRLSSIRSAPASSTSLARPGGNITGFMLFEYS